MHFDRQKMAMQNRRQIDKRPGKRLGRRQRVEEFLLFHYVFMLVRVDGSAGWLDCAALALAPDLNAQITVFAGECGASELGVRKFTYFVSVYSFVVYLWRILCWRCNSL